MSQIIHAMRLSPSVRPHSGYNGVDRSAARLLKRYANCRPFIPG